MTFAALDRFVAAQDAAGTYVRAVAELRAGRKATHWMWFVFPQLAGLGTSAMAQRYALTSLDEARAYLRHELLGPRLLECTGLVVTADTASADEMFGGVDAMKLRSSMTLFELAATDVPDADPSPYRAVLDQWFDGRADGETQRLLGRPQPG